MPLPAPGAPASLPAGSPSANIAGKDAGTPGAPVFHGRHFRGRGDTNYLQLLEAARGLFEPNPALQNLTMLYEPKWNGLVEGPTWDAWWIQNSYGTTYSILPWIGEPFLTFLQNSQNLWFDQMGDGKRVGSAPPFDWVAPDGALCDAARPGWIVYKQGDGRTAIHDWGMEFTAAGVLMQAELLLIGRDTNALAHYLPLLERSVRFIESRRDAANNLFLAGPAGNLLAPGYAGWKRPDGSYGQAYLTGLSITYIAALNRVIELEKLANRIGQARLFQLRRDSAREGLERLTTSEGYFIRSLDPDGVKHGVFGAERHGYFETSPNHDAIVFRIVDDSQAERILQKIESIPQLRPHDFILPNYPSYDDMYEKAEGLWGYGTWVNGGHWSTCEARMVLAYYRLNRFEDARRSMRRLLSFAEQFRLDNPLTQCGAAVYQPNQPVNLCYDTFGPAGAFVRGLFEYLYSSDSLTLVPHIPPGIDELQQLNPVRFGHKQIYISTVGSGPVTSVRVNERGWNAFDATSVRLPYLATPVISHVVINLGHRKPKALPVQLSRNASMAIPLEGWPAGSDSLRSLAERLCSFHKASVMAGYADSYEAAHARLAIETALTVVRRYEMQMSAALVPLPGPSQEAADKAYVNAAVNLAAGLASKLQSYAGSTDPQKSTIYRIWNEACGKAVDRQPAGPHQGTK